MVARSPCARSLSAISISLLVSGHFDTTECFIECRTPHGTFLIQHDRDGLFDTIEEVFPFPFFHSRNRTCDNTAIPKSCPEELSVGDLGQLVDHMFVSAWLVTEIDASGVGQLECPDLTPD